MTTFAYENEQENVLGADYLAELDAMDQPALTAELTRVTDTLCQPDPVTSVPQGTGSAKRWKQCAIDEINERITP